VEPINFGGLVHLVDNGSRVHPITRSSVSVAIPTPNEGENLAFVRSSVSERVNENVALDGRSTNDSMRVAKTRSRVVRSTREARRGKDCALSANLAAGSGDIRIIVGAERQALRDASISRTGSVRDSRFCAQAVSVGIVLQTTHSPELVHILQPTTRAG